jgi:hypothetical protein
MGSHDLRKTHVHKDLEPDKAAGVARARAGIGICPEGISGTPWKASLPELRRCGFMGSHQALGAGIGSMNGFGGVRFMERAVRGEGHHRPPEFAPPLWELITAAASILADKNLPVVGAFADRNDRMTVFLGTFGNVFCSLLVQENQ